MIALFALLTTPVVGNLDCGIAFARDLISVDHLCNTLTLKGAGAYAAGSRGFSIYVKTSDYALAERILEQDRKSFPFHHGRMTQREVPEPVEGEQRIFLNVGRESLSTLQRDPLLQTLVVQSLEWAERGVDEPYVREVFLSNARYLDGDGSMRNAYFGRVLLADRENSSHFGYVELYVKSRAAEKDIQFGVWGENTLEILASAAND